MSVTTNTIGTNSRQLVISGETSIDNILTAVSNALVALGWTAYDTVTTGANNAQVRQIFRVLCADGTTYKYLGILWHPNKGLFHTTCYESWNNTTHVGTNEVFTNGYTFPQGVQYSNCSIYIFASARWAVLFSYVHGEPGPWSGVFEFEREVAEDTTGAGYPPFAWTCSNIIGEPVGHHQSVGTSSADAWCMSFPRTPHPYTGVDAAMYTSIISGFGQYPTGIPTGYQINHAGKLGGAIASYAWDTSKKPIHVLKGAGVNSAFPHGRMYGVKAIGPTGDILDTVVLPVDANYHYVSSGGTNTDHLVLPINGGYHMNYNYGANKLAGTLFGTGMASTDSYDGVLVKGKFIYTGCASGIWKIDIDSGVCALVYSTATVSSVEYDGGAYIYFATGAGVTRLAVADDSLTHLTAGTGGCVALAIDETYIYASSRTPSTTPKIDCILRSTFTVEGSYTFTALSQSSQACSLCVDYAGNCYALVGNVSEGYLYKVVGSTRAGSRVSLGNGGNNGCAASGLYCDGLDLVCIFSGNNSSGGVAVGWAWHRVSTSLGIAHTANINVGSYLDSRASGVSHPATPMKGVVVGASGLPWSTSMAVPHKAISIMDNSSGYSHSTAGSTYATSFPTHPNSGQYCNNLRNFGSLYLTFTHNDAYPVCLTTGMHGKYNYYGSATAHILIPA